MATELSSKNGIKLKNKIAFDLDMFDDFISFSTQERKEFISLFFTEGIPFAFRLNPLFFEEIRIWLSQQLDINPKQITITGSSRIGFSIAPDKWGNAYSQMSDLDFIIVSKSLFDDFKADFRKFSNEVKKKLEAKQAISKWDIANIKMLSNSIPKGFLDQFKIPRKKIYPNVFHAYSVLDELLKKMKLTQNCPSPPKASFRIYENWEACVNRISFNIEQSHSQKV